MVQLKKIYQEALNKLKDNPNAYYYYESGADYEQTLADNEHAYKRYKVYPHLLKKDASDGDIDLTVNAFGTKFKIPIFLAPTAMQKMAHVDGEIGTAKAALSFGTCMGVSTLSTTSYENISKAVPDGTYAMQLYVYKERDLSVKLIKRAELAGFKSIIMTVDTPVLGQRIADVKQKFRLPDHLSLENYDNISDVKAVDEGLMNYISGNILNSLSWDDIAWVRSVTHLPIYLKGIITREDAEKCLNYDVHGIIVSNHGGRQLDGVPATIDALSEVVRAVGDKLPVYVDGGIRCGSDVFKALALGAKGVFIGRPVLYGLAYNGYEGIMEILHHMKDELESLMKLTGCRKIADIKSSLIFHESKYGIQTPFKITRHWGYTPENPVCIADIKEGVLQRNGKVDNDVEISLEEAFHRLRFRPSRLQGLSSIDTSGNLFGKKLKSPICFLEDDSTQLIADELKVKSDPWFLKVDEITEIKKKLRGESQQNYAGLIIDILQDDLKSVASSLRNITYLPILVTGVMGVEDALACLEFGVDGLVVTNGSGCSNQVNAIDVLPEISVAVRGKVPIILQGGIRKGTDIIKAIALGASCVIVKEPLLWASFIQSKKSQGISNVVEILTKEMWRAMYLLGCKDVSSIRKSMVVHEQYYYGTNHKDLSRL